MQALLQAFADARLGDVRVVQSYIGQLMQQGSLTAPDEAQLSALVSTVLTTLAINLVLLLLLPRGRKLVFDTVETVLAIALIIVLIGVVLGLPLGIIYLVLRAVAFLLNLILGIPAVAGLMASLRSRAGL